MEIKIDNYFATSIILILFLFYLANSGEYCSGSQIIIMNNNDYYQKNFSKIQNAIDSANDGDTLILFNGTYYENLIVNKSISIVGNDRSNTVIEGFGSEILIHISEKNVKISSITIKNGNIGIYVKGDNDILTNASISNVTLSKNNVSIYFSSVSNSNIMNSNISGNIDGITLFNSSSNCIKNNTIKFQKNLGVSLWDHSNNNEISFNIVYDNNIGLLLKRWQDGNIIKNNIISNNSLGISLELYSNTTINQNFIFYNYYGIRLERSLGNNSIYDNKIEENYYGIDVDESAKYNLSNDHLFNNTYDIKKEVGMPKIKTPGFEIFIIIILFSSYVFFIRRKKSIDK